jgi:hypothetical protein
MKKPFMVLSRGLVYFFVFSHIFAWFISFGQTIWIVSEIRKKAQ